MSDWIDAGDTGGCAEPDKKGCLIAVIFFVVLMIVAFVALPLLFE